MIVKSFGCSFIFGTDLADAGHGTDASNFTWPALIAQQLGTKYICRAQGGIGNFIILRRILENISMDRGQDAFYIISWTWIDRFDYLLENTDPKLNEQWHTLTPAEHSTPADFYYRNFHTELKDKMSSLVYIKSAIDTLNQNNIPFLMTYMDPLILDQTWHAPAMVTDCQAAVTPWLKTFEGQTLLEWSKNKGFPISETLHPLESAHAAAADIIMPLAKSTLFDHNLV